MALVAQSRWAPAVVGFLLAFLVYVAVAPWLVPIVVPMSFYYTLDGIEVENATVGESPKMVVAGESNRPFRGWYEVEIERVVGSVFALYNACGPHRTPEFTVSPTRDLPNPMTLDWWLGIPPNRECLLPPGDYRIVTTIYARSFFDAVVTERAPSNTFTIRKPRK
jgi:hypothetical protein